MARTTERESVDVRARVREFLKSELNRDMAGISDAESLLEAGILDSMSVVQLVAFLEREFGLTIGDDDLMPENFDSIVAVESFVRRSTSSGG
jgi:acyl carrier protein